MNRYVWQNDSWPRFRWDSSTLLSTLGKARRTQGEVLAKADWFELKAEADVLAEEAFTTSAIEGEKLKRDSLRSSIARRLGLPTAGLPAPDRRTDGLIEMLINATRRHEAPLNARRLKGWHAALFPTGYSGLHKIEAGSFRKGKEPMQVVSGPIGREKIHYEAPPAHALSKEVRQFLDWFNSPPRALDGLLRAAIAHFWFVTIHPFHDGNGRIARAITDMALAQDEKRNCRLYSMSAQIVVERRGYYSILENTQKGTGDITPWLIWFLKCLERAIRRADLEIRKSMQRAGFWQRISQHVLNARQRKVLGRLLEAGSAGFVGGLSNEKYRKIAKTTRETAKRDLGDLVSKGILERKAGQGRGASYELKLTE